MAAVEVHDTATDAARRPAPNARVTISLYASADGRGAGMVTTAEASVVASYRPQVNDSTGHWAIDLEPNVNILPAGSVYVVTTQAPGEKARVQYIAVPDDDSVPHWVGSILVDPPGTLPTAALSLEVANREAALQAEETARVEADIAAAADATTKANAAQAAAIAHADTADALLIPHTWRGAASGVASLDGAGTIPDAQIPATIARDSEVSTAVSAAVAALVASSPSTLDTLNELAVALGNDPNFAATIAGQIVPVGSDRWLKLHAADPDKIIVGAVTRDANEAATGAGVVWPDGKVGTYTATTVSTAFPGAVDAYTVTYGSPVTKTVTQPAVTRDAAGAVTNRPALVVS